MGRTRKIRWVFYPEAIYNIYRPSWQAWPVKHFGTPTVEKIKAYIRDYNQALEPNGVNSHIGRAGAIFGGRVYNQFTGEEISYYDKSIFNWYKSRPKFEAI